MRVEFKAVDERARFPAFDGTHGQLRGDIQAHGGVDSTRF